MTVDEILATGQYTDRRFRLWEHSQNMRTGEECWMIWEPYFRRTELTPAQIRLLIERDQHRDECPGLNACNGHPVPSVITPIAWGSRDFEVYAAWANTTSTFKQSLPEAMDAARALAVGE